MIYCPYKDCGYPAENKLVLIGHIHMVHVALFSPVISYWWDKPKQLEQGNDLQPSSLDDQLRNAKASSKRSETAK